MNVNVCPGVNPVPAMVTLVPTPPEFGFTVIDCPEEVALPVRASEVALPDGVPEVSFPAGTWASAALPVIRPVAATAPRIARQSAIARVVCLIFDVSIFSHSFGKRLN